MSKKKPRKRRTKLKTTFKLLMKGNERTWTGGDGGPGPIAV